MRVVKRVVKFPTGFCYRVRRWVTRSATEWSGDVRAAGRLRAETTMTLKWIAQELHMGAWTHVSKLLSQRRQPPKSKRRRNCVNS